MMSNLKPCFKCGASAKELMGYDYHKLGCSNEDCGVSCLALTKEDWNTRPIEDQLTQSLAAAQKEIAELRSALINSQKIMNTFGLIHCDEEYTKAEKCKRADALIDTHMDEVFIKNKQLLAKGE